MTNLNHGVLDATAYPSLGEQLEDYHADNSSLILEKCKEGLSDLKQNAYSALLILDETDREEARKLVGENVFTEQEAQGLEFEITGIYLSRQVLGECVAISKLMQEEGIDALTELSEKRNGSPMKGKMVNLDILSRLCVALSRSSGAVRVYIEPIENKQISHQINVFLTWLHKQFDPTTQQKVKAQQSRPEDWLRMINEFILQNKGLQAKSNLERHFALTSEQATRYINLSHAELLHDVDALGRWKETPIRIKPVLATKNAQKGGGAARPEPSKVRERSVENPHLTREALEPPQVAALDEKWTKYAEGLIKSNSPNRFRLMNVAIDEGVATRLLFTSRMSNGHCLYVALCLSGQQNDIHSAVDVVKLKPTLPLKETPDYLLDVFWRYKGDRESSIKILAKNHLSKLLSSDLGVCYFLMNIDQFVKHVDEKWFAIKSVPSPLLLLAITQQGRSFLLSNFQHYRRKIVNEELFAIQECGVLGRSSVFLWLSSSYTDGYSLLAKILESNPRLAETITSDDLCAKRTDKDGIDENTSALYWLSGSPEGCQILANILKNNPCLGQTITSDALCAKRTAKAGISENISALYLLSAHTQGRQILAKILENNPRLGQTITSDAFCAKRTAEAGADENTSALYWLSGNDDGRPILANILENNPRLAETITSDALCAKRTAEAGTNENTSALYWLSGNHDGRPILAKILENNPGLAETITSDAFCAKRTAEAGADENTSALYWLSANPEGSQILAKILENNPRLAETITSDAFCAKRTAEAGTNENTSALYWLSESFEGRQILTKILEINPRLGQTITSDALCVKRTAEAGIHENTSVLDLLKKSPDGMRLLEKIVKHHSNLAHSESRFSLFGPSSELKAKPEDSCPRGTVKLCKGC